MSYLTNFGENKLVDYLRAQGIASLPANWYLGLLSAFAEGSVTELSGTGYARVSRARSLANFAGTQAAGSTLASTGTSHATSNNAAVSWGTPGGNWGTATYVGFFDASTAGNCWFVVPITSTVITTGNPDPVQIASAGLSMTLGLTGGLSDYFSNALIDLVWRAQAFSLPTPWYVALYTATPSNSGGGTEATGGSYARVSLTPDDLTLYSTQGDTSAASSGSAGRTANVAAVTFPSPTADWGTVVAMGILDASSGGNLLFWHALTSSQSVVSGGPAPAFASDALGITLA
jgi:hypothetical protein